MAEEYYKTNISGFEVLVKRTIDHENLYTPSDLEREISNNAIPHNCVIRNGSIKRLAPLETVWGTLGLSDCQLETLSPVEYVAHDIWCSYYDRRPVLKTLGTLNKVGGDANFRYMPLQDIGKLEYVGGKLSLRDTLINDLGRLKYVGGDLYLPMRLKGVVDLSSITIKGKVKYWKDSMKECLEMLPDTNECVLSCSDISVPSWPNCYIYPGHVMSSESKPVQEYYKYFKSKFNQGILLDVGAYLNYCFVLLYDLERHISDVNILREKYDFLKKGYPKLRTYCDEIILKRTTNDGDYEESWSMIKNREYLDVKTVNKYSLLLGDSIFDGNIAAKIAGVGCLTEFGKRHVDEVLQFFVSCREEYEREHCCRFFDLFYDNNLGYKEICGCYSPEYYRQFYVLNEGDYETYYTIGNDSYHKKHLDSILLVDHAVCEQIRVLLIRSEDKYRESIGISKIGERWISETALYYKIKNYFGSYSVVQHGHPKWLGRQHLDIYFNEVNVAVEYQGIQHYQPIEFFGGEEGYENNQERDARKRRLCNENGCTLIEVSEGYIFDDVCKLIQEAISHNCKC